MRKRNSTPILTVALLALGIGCASGDTNKTIERQPNFDFGAGAKVLLPGQSLPMPGPGQPGGPSVGEVTFLGGSKSQGKTHRVVTSDPKESAMAAATGPAGVLAAPAGAAVEGIRRATGQGQGSTEPEQEQTAPGGAPMHQQTAPTSAPMQQQTTRTGQGQQHSSRSAPSPGVTAPSPQPPVVSDPHRAVENARLAELERQLGGGSGGVPPIPLPLPVPGGAPEPPPEPTQHASVAPAPTGRSFSIADELAVLQAGLPPKARPEDMAQARAGTSPSEPNPRRGGVADEVSDRDGDGRPDRWVYRHQGQRVRELFDEDGDSAPDRTVYFDRQGKEQSVEEDTNLDGRLDSWAEYRAGEMARQRRDTDFDGFLDTWTFYRDGQIAREEQDLNGDGFRNRMAFYENGRLVREREDRDGDGRVDRVTLYDAEQRVLQRDEDQDGDGLIDTRSYYEEGRLARRELLEEALQESVDRETLSQPVWDEGSS